MDDDSDAVRPGRSRRTLPAMMSAAVIAAAALAVAGRPDVLGEGGRLLDRAALALFLVGLVGSAAHAAGLVPGRRPLRLVCSPGIAWPATGLGLAWLLVIAG